MARMRPPSAPLVCSFHSRNEPRTLASTTRSGWTVLGLGGRGKLSEMPVLGALKAERGKVGRDFGPFLRAPTPGDLGVGLVAIIRVAVCGAKMNRHPSLTLSNFKYRFPTFIFAFAFASRLLTSNFVLSCLCLETKYKYSEISVYASRGVIAARRPRTFLVSSVAPTMQYGSLVNVNESNHQTQPTSACVPSSGERVE
jgi:hypothetical protein